MPRENSFSDSDGERSLTPDLVDELERERAFAATHSESQTSPAGPSATDGNDAHKAMARKPTPLMANLAKEAIKSQQSFKDVPTSPTKSHKTHRTNRTHQPPHAFATPKDRFRAAAKKIIQMRRTSTYMSRGRIGAEPGIDARSATAYMNYGHIRQVSIKFGTLFLPVVPDRATVSRVMLLRRR